MSYPQANVPSLRSSWQLLNDLVSAQDLLIHPPRILIANGEAFPKNKDMVLRSLQNLGTDVIYWYVAPAPDNASTVNFHGVLAAGDAEDDGKGGIVDLSRFQGRVSIYCTGTPRVATFEASRQTPPA